MSYNVKNTVKDRETGEFKEIDLDVNIYCSNIINKIFSVIYQIEEMGDVCLKDNKELHSTTFDIIGLVNRIPTNIYLKGDDDERL